MKKENGITLIALVITIIVLLILAGVSISLVVGNNEDGSPLLISGGRDKNIIVWKLNLNEKGSLLDKTLIYEGDKINLEILKLFL